MDTTITLHEHDTFARVDGLLTVLISNRDVLEMSDSVFLLLCDAHTELSDAGQHVSADGGVDIWDLADGLNRLQEALDEHLTTSPNLALTLRAHAARNIVNKAVALA